MTAGLVVDRPAAAPVATILLAHGAGAAMDSAAMNAFTAALTAAGLAVARFEFAYMVARRTGRRPPPPRAERLVPEFAAALAGLLAAVDGPVLVGGKSLGGRVATLAAATDLDPRVIGVVAWGFPFHPPGAPERSRLGALAGSRLPVLVCQGTRDPFGDRATVEAVPVPAHVMVTWFEDGDHDLAPRRTSGHTTEAHHAAAAAAIAAFAAAQVGSEKAAGSNP